MNTAVCALARPCDCDLLCCCSSFASSIYVCLLLGAGFAGVQAGGPDFSRERAAPCGRASSCCPRSHSRSDCALRLANRRMAEPVLGELDEAPPLLTGSSGEGRASVRHTSKILVAAVRTGHRPSALRPPPAPPPRPGSAYHSRAFVLMQRARRRRTVGLAATTAAGPLI